MATVFETGRAVNASNFVEKVNIIERRKSEYKPTNPAILLEALLPKKKIVQDVLEDVSAATEAKISAVNKRLAVYEEMEKRASSSVNILGSSDASTFEINRGKTLLKKFKSIRLTDIPNEEEIKVKAALKGTTPIIPKKISISQQGFINRLSHFRDLINYLGTVTAYQPEEADLTIIALKELATKAEGLNENRNKQGDLLADAVENRETVMNSEPNGAYYLSKKIMLYVLGSHGRGSAFYKELVKYPVHK